MTRRRFVGLFASFALAGQLFKGKLFGWGYLDVKRHALLRSRGIYLRVWCDGEDATSRCFEANDRTGYVGLYKHRDGRAYIERTPTGVEVARETRYGRVQFVPLSKTEWENIRR